MYLPNFLCLNLHSLSASSYLLPIKKLVACRTAIRISHGNPRVAAVRDRLIAQHPELARWRDLTRFGINLEFVEPDITLQNGDEEVVLIPPVSGG